MAAVVALPDVTTVWETPVKRDGSTGYDRRYTMTNGDRIRAMTDRELCEFLGFVAQDAFCYGAGLRNEMKIYPFGTYESTMEWLQKEVDDAKT